MATSYSTDRLNVSSSGFTVSGDYITMTTGTPLLFELDGLSSNFTLKYESYYLGYSNNSANLEEVTDSKSSKEKWALTYNDANSTYLIANVYAPDRFLGMHPSLYYIKAYLITSINNYSVSYLYRKVSTLTLASACTDGERFYGTYSLGTAFVVPSDLTVSEIKVSADGKLTVGNYSTGDVVPANTGVMVSSSTAGDHSVTLTSAAGSSIFGSENMLKPSGNGITAEAMAEANGGCKYYRLTMHNGTTLGYYWGAADGAAFALGANKAYLAVPTGIGARLTGFDMADGEATGIGAALNDRGEMKNNELIYDLQGRRMANSQLRKGLYVVNGKKHIIK